MQLVPLRGGEAAGGADAGVGGGGQARGAHHRLPAAGAAERGQGQAAGQGGHQGWPGPVTHGRRGGAITLTIPCISRRSHALSHPVYTVQV